MKRLTMPAYGILARSKSIPAMLAGTLILGACGGGSGEYAAPENPAPPSGPASKYNPNDEGIFGEGGLSLSSLANGELFGGKKNSGEALPINKYLWQASLDTLSFLPLASTDPFTGVIATDWGMTPDAPGERFKVTVYISSSALEASSLKVGVYREAQDAGSQWRPAPVDPETARKLEDAILTRARQIRIAEVEGDPTG